MKKMQLYAEYLESLNEYGANIPESKYDEEIYYHRFTKDIEWNPVIVDGNEVGFLLIGKDTECVPGYDYFISQTYIQPKYRRQGIMKKIVTDYVKAHKGRYCLFILEKNYPAKNFWKTVQLTLNLKTITCPTEFDDEGCKLYGFEYE